MMRDLITTSVFKKDIKRAKNRDKDLQKIFAIIDRLLNNHPLERSHKAHKLTGNMAPYHECHIEPDWLLIWDENDQEITLVRTGSHADLFP